MTDGTHDGLKRPWATKSKVYAIHKLVRIKSCAVMRVVLPLPGVVNAYVAELTDACRLTTCLQPHTFAEVFHAPLFADARASDHVNLLSSMRECRVTITIHQGDAPVEVRRQGGVSLGGWWLISVALVAADIQRCRQKLIQVMQERAI